MLAHDPGEPPRAPVDPAQLNSFYEQWYTPDNMTLYVVGNVDSRTIMEQIGKTFATLKTPAISSYDYTQYNLSLPNNRPELLKEALNWLAATAGKMSINEQVVATALSATDPIATWPSDTQDVWVLTTPQRPSDRIELRLVVNTGSLAESAQQTGFSHLLPRLAMVHNTALDTNQQRALWQQAMDPQRPLGFPGGQSVRANKRLSV
ncbi:hypothetical protein CRX72_01960 [Pantoea sp. BRM17]|nr:hypothetical protein CRX72_01960 [Pantoea sp. BRM17]